MSHRQNFKNKKEGTLYLVPTPIGNLEDMTFRAIRIMKEVDVIAAEDTRNTIKLLNHFEIDTKMISYHQHNENTRQRELVIKLKEGMSIALVSDAGTPSISDPGYELVKKAIEENITVVPLPGANAALTALIASGIVPQPFYFYGFLPREKKARKEILEELARRSETWILYESPHRLKEALKAIFVAVGGSRKMVLCRELTKRYEEFLRGTVDEVLKWAQNGQIRGEFCLIIEGNSEPLINENLTWWNELSIKEHVKQVMESSGVIAKEAIKKVAEVRKLPKKEVYRAYHQL